jgi:predicted transcriptional regulator
MNKLLPVLALSLTMSFGTVANESTEVCVKYSELAAEIMSSRQSNIPIAKIYELLKGSDLSIALLKKAYKEPLWTAEQNKKKAVNEFANEVFMICIGAIGDKKEA